jgi:hypothetical protein
MRHPAIVIVPILLLLSACAPEHRDQGAAAPAASPVAAPAAQVTAPPEADAHAHHHESGTGATLERPPGGGNWATDAPLRQGMQRIHAAMADALPAFERGELSTEAATAVANEVQAQVQFLVANCKLQPAADAQLHLLIGQMLAAADALAKDPFSSDGMPRLHQAVQLYGDHFDHPGLHDHGGEPHHADGGHAHDADGAEPVGG